MSAVALAGLARPHTSADRRRWWLIVVACAGTSTLLLAFLRILRLPAPDDGSGGQYAAYIEEPGLRAGTLTGALLCCVPLLVLLIQALRVGSAARERRLIALRVAGASRRQLRGLAALEGASAGIAGSVVGAAGYLVLGGLTPRIPDVNLRLVPTADWLDLLVIPLVVLTTAALAGLSAMLSARDVVVAPQRVNLREPRPLPRGRAVLAAVLFALTCATVPAIWYVEPAIFGVIFAFVVLAFVAAPYVVLLAAWWLDRSRDPMRQLAAARLRADSRAPGRIVSVVAVCGAAISIGAVYLVAIAREADGEDSGGLYGSGDGFYVTGGVLAMAAVLVALAVSVLSLIVAAVEQILDARRATAVLTAFGVSVKDLRRALRRQLTTVTVLAAGIGSALPTVAFVATSGEWPDPVDLAVTAIGSVAISITVAAVVAWIPTAFLAPQIAEATSAENLRTA